MARQHRKALPQQSSRVILTVSLCERSWLQTRHTGQETFCGTTSSALQRDVGCPPQRRSSERRRPGLGFVGTGKKSFTSAALTVRGMTASLRMHRASKEEQHGGLPWRLQ